MAEDSAFSLKRFLVGKPIPRTWRTTNACPVSRAWPCCRRTRCRRSRMRPTSSWPRSSSRAWARSSTPVPISLVIAALLAIVAFSYRQTIHAYPTGGGAYIVAKENIGPTAGLIAAASLLVDYTLTVAVSISGRRPRDHVRISPARPVPRRDVPRVSRDPHRRQPARHPGVGQHLCGADLFLRVQHRAASRCRAVSVSHRRHRARRCAAAGERRTASVDDVPAADGVCERLHRDDRRRGRVERRARVPAARGEERLGDARDDGDAGDRDVRRHHRAGARVQGRAEQRRVGDLAAGPGDLRRAEHPLLPAPGRHDADPRARGEHGVRRFSPARVDRVARPLSPAPVHEPGRPARVLERHPGALGVRGDPHRRRSAATRSRCCRST